MSHDRDAVPPVGLAPEGRDFAHPYIISAIVSVICFAVGFAVLWFTGLWEQFQQWADTPFLIYFAILMPVILGFTIYGIGVAVGRMFRRGS